jgi:hypothetical protein
MTLDWLTMQKRLKWQRIRTLERLEYIRRNLNKTDGEIGKRFGISRQAVSFLRQRYKIAKVHGATQRMHLKVEQLRKLKPGFTSRGAAQKMGVAQATVLELGKLAGYRFTSPNAIRHFYWRKRLAGVPPLLTLAALARRLGVSEGYTALLCHRHKYKVTIPERYGQPPRVPIRNYLRRPKHERWLASLKSPRWTGKPGT